MTDNNASATPQAPPYQPPAQQQVPVQEMPISGQTHLQSMINLAREATTILPLEELLQTFSPLDARLTIADLVEEKKVRRGLGLSGTQSRIQSELLQIESQFQYSMPMSLDIRGVIEQLGNVSSLLATVIQKMSDTKLYFERAKKRRLSVYRAALRVASGTVEDKKAYAEDVASNSLQDVEMDMAQDKHMKLESIFNALEGQFNALRKIANLIELETQLRFGGGRFKE